MRFAIGQQYYFKSQQVTLNEPPRTSNTSDLLVSGRGPAVRYLDRGRCAAVPGQSQADGAIRHRRTLSACLRPGTQCRVSLHPPIPRLERTDFTTQADRRVGAVSVPRQLVRDRPLELLAGRRQDAGGRTWLRVQWRVLGFSHRRATAADQHAAGDDRRCSYSSNSTVSPALARIRAMFSGAAFPAIRRRTIQRCGRPATGRPITSRSFRLRR